MTRATSTSTAPACPPPASHGADTIISSSSMGSNSSSTSSRIGRRQRRRLAHVGTLALLALAPLLLGSCCQAFLVPAHAPTGPCSAAASLARRRHVGWAGQSALLRSGEGSGLRMAPLFAKGATTKAATGGGRGRRRAAAAPEEEGDEAKENTTMLLGSQDEEAGGDVDALILGSGEVDEAGEAAVPVMLGTQSAAAAAALKEATADPGVAGVAAAEAEAEAEAKEAGEEEVDIASAPLPAAPTKRRGGRGSKRASAYPEQDYSVKTVDDVCRATINVISSGDEADLQMLTPFVERLLTRYGDHVEILHRSYVPDDKPGLRLLEIWFEGFETFRLYSRYQFTKRGKQGDLTPEVIDEMCSKIDYAMYLDATGDFGPL